MKKEHQNRVEPEPEHTAAVKARQVREIRAELEETLLRIKKSNAEREDEA